MRYKVDDARLTREGTRRLATSLKSGLVALIHSFCLLVS